MINDSEYIIASAGTGKTESLSRKIENLIINENVDILKIAMITFTNKATREMKDRLKTKLYKAWGNGDQRAREQLDKLNMTKISTIHLFCDDIIRKFGMNIGISPTYRISNFSFETNNIIDKVIEEHYNEELCIDIPTFKISDIIKKLYKETRDKGQNLEIDEDSYRGYWGNFRKYILSLYNIVVIAVEKAKRENNVLTNNDLLSYAAKLVKDKNIAKAIASEIEYLFIDECQDINYDQESLFASLLPYVKITIVGDEKQSIYSFRGSDKNAFEALVDKMHENKAKETVFNTNYRSNEELIRKINKIFNSKFYYNGRKINFKNIPLKPTKQESKYDEVFGVYYNYGISSVVKDLAVDVANENNQGYNIVVLCRTNNEADIAYERLKSEGINVELFSSRSIYSSRAIIDLYKILKYLVTESKIDKHELFYTDYYLAAVKFFDENYLVDLLTVLSAEARKESLSYIVNRLTESINICDYYISVGKEQYVANLNRFKEIIRNLSCQGLSTIQIIDKLNVMIETQQREAQPEIVSKADVVVSTIHMFKGLSADTVIINWADISLRKSNINATYLYNHKEKSLGFNKDTIAPYNSRIPYDAKFAELKEKDFIAYLEEELRLFYVACTRARERLILSTREKENHILYLMDRKPEYVSYIRWWKESRG